MIQFKYEYFFFRDFYVAWYLIFLIYKGIARKRWTEAIKGKILLHCTSLQFYMVHCTWILLLNSHKHIMGLLGFLQISDSSANRFRHERLRTWSHNTWLVRRGILLVQPSHFTIFRHCQCVCRLCTHSVCCNSHSILGLQCLQCW